ncbi:MAG: carotenoid oxygenase family protein [Burkholderiaceae bacterium]|nr:carotenoid oxygenase family protein [Burkholderiaceae bacterium]
MSKPFPADEPFLQGYYAPLSAECDAAHLPVSGELPRELFGTLYRNGPNPQFAPRGPYHWFAGDGMLHAFHLEDGRASYRNRWVRTPKWELEHAEGEGLSAAFGSPRGSDPRIVALDSTTANTNVIWHGGRLLALEEAHAPFEVDPATLAPLGYQTFEGRLAGPMTAHPKIDPVTGEMIFFGYSTREPLGADMMLHVADKDGRLLRSEHFMAPFASMVHDFVVTRSHVIFPIFPLTGSMERAMKGLPPYAWEPDKGTHIGILPRGGSVADLRWFQGDPCYVFHPMNAFDDADGGVVCDMAKYAVAPLFPRPDGSPTGDRSPAARLVRWRFDMRDGTQAGYREQVLDDSACEFPRLDERFAMLPYRHGYLNTMPAGDAQRATDDRWGLSHIDLQSGQKRSWNPPPGDACGEPVFVPRGANAPEGDGWLLSVIWRQNENRSDLAVFDATDLGAGPVALVHLSHRVPAGFHGNWRPGGTLDVC